MTITSLILPIFILLIILFICHPIKTIRITAKFFVLIMFIIIGLFMVGLLVAQLFNSAFTLIGL
ncbi:MULTISPECIES: hypothetical protein [unclassified Staphylococcus]|uniref:hypothetical protein n=1 Tax=unclassified Staphylococcus TaxID=91994 RepID=UPI00194E2A0C|nr:MULTISPECIES: hypothetical protein [unclassified Staphylococcus]